MSPRSRHEAQESQAEDAGVLVPSHVLSSELHLSWVIWLLYTLRYHPPHPQSSFTSLPYSDARFLPEHGQNGKHPTLPAQEYLRGLLSPKTRVTPATPQELMSSPAGEQRETYTHLNRHFNYIALKSPQTSHWRIPAGPWLRST